MPDRMVRVRATARRDHAAGPISALRAALGSSMLTGTRRERFEHAADIDAAVAGQQALLPRRMQQAFDRVRHAGGASQICT